MVFITKVRVSCLVAVAALSLGHPRAQGNELVIQQHVRANHLSATVIDATGEAIPRAKISLFVCPKGEFKGASNFIPIAETLADQQGRFSLPWPGKRVCLQAASLGMNLLQIEVLRDSRAGELQVKLVPGT
jgi:hypothetical protein